jgi:hypothetical protein
MTYRQFGTESARRKRSFAIKVRSGFALGKIHQLNHTLFDQLKDRLIRRMNVVKVQRANVRVAKCVTGAQ